MRREISTGHKHVEKVTHRTSEGREIQAEGIACLVEEDSRPEQSLGAVQC